MHANAPKMARRWDKETPKSVLKRLPNEELYGWVNKTGSFIGVAITLGLAKCKWTKNLWNSTIEPYFVDLIENTFKAFLDGFLKGLRSDN